MTGLTGWCRKGAECRRKEKKKEFRGIFLTVEDVDAGDISYGSMALATPQKATWKTHWQYGGWWDGAEEFWRDFSEGRRTCRGGKTVRTDSAGAVCGFSSGKAEIEGRRKAGVYLLCGVAFPEPVRMVAGWA